MIEDHLRHLSSQEMGERFDLLAADAKEYAVFLVEPGRAVCSAGTPGPSAFSATESDEIIGQHFSRFFSPEDVLDRPARARTQDGAGRRAGRTAYCWQVRKDGTRFWCQATVTPLLRRDEAGPVLRPGDARPHRERGGGGPAASGRTAWPKPTGARRSSWPCCPTNCETRSRPSSTP